MNRNKSLAQYLANSSVPIREVLSVFLLAVICCSFTATASRPPEKEIPYRITLQTRAFVPEPGIDPALAEDVVMRLGRGQTSHVYVQLYGPLDGCQHADLEAQGVKLLAYIGNNTWCASLFVPSTAYLKDLAVVAASPALAAVRWMGPILPEDKIAPAVADGQIGDWARTADGDVELVVKYFGDARREDVRETLTVHGATIVGELPAFKEFVVTVADDGISALTAEDCVRWIEVVPPPSQPESNRVRSHIQANLAQNLGLTGDGVTVGIFEQGHVDEHVDLLGRVTTGDTGDVDSHPTMVGGMIAGDGAVNLLYRGMAVSAEIVTFDFRDESANPTLAQQYADYQGDLQTAIGTYVVDLANNSWGTAGSLPSYEYGQYVGYCDDLDGAVRGDYGNPTTIVFSGGNERDGYWDEATNQERQDHITDKNPPYNNYMTVNHPKAAKNTLVVGAIDSDNDRMSNYSSWGPTADGRIKPEIVASGHHNGTLDSQITILDNPFGNPVGSANQQGYRTPIFDLVYTYGWFTQTSCAAAATSGAIALLLEEYWDVMQTEINPLPSTIKALLIHTAEDLTDNNTTWYNPGPDYASGYGLLQIKDAIDLVGTGQFLEGKVNAGESDYYYFKVPAGAGSVKVTLVWDDAPAAQGATSTLVNDLDLIVRDPANTRYYPWTLNPNNHSAAAVQTTEDHTNNVEQVVWVESPGTFPSGDWEVEVKGYLVSQAPQRYSLVANYPLIGKIDIMQVLDRSGSMTGMASPNMTDKKIDVLKYAANQFIDMMQADIGNQLGMVQFNENVVAFPTNSADALSSLTTANRAAKKSTVNSILADGWTSIGDGLRDALNQLKASVAQNDRRVLLVSDGKENRSEMIASVQPDLITDSVTVYCLGLGYGSGINEGKLTKLAEDTGGTYRISADHLVFRKLFIEALANAVDWAVINDPIGELTAGQTVRMPVSIAPDEDSATVTAYWEGIEDAIRLELITPSGKVISPDTANRWIRYGHHPRYAFYQLDFPLGDDLTSEWGGQWEARLTGTDQIDPPQRVRYSASALAEGGVELVVTLDHLFHLTGDRVQMTAQLIRSNQPLTGAQLDVYGDVPLVGVGNILHKHHIDPNDLPLVPPTKGDTMTLVEQKLQYLDNLYGQSVLQRGLVSFRLYDDGLHGDGQADDGLYANSFTQTQIPGSYTFRFVASDIPAGGGHTTTREWTKSFYNEVHVDRDYSDVVIQQSAVTADGIRYRVDILPRDRFGNYLGPEHNVEVVIAYAGKERAVSLADLTDGRYSGEILVTHTERAAGALLNFSIDQVLAGPLIDPSLVAHWTLDEATGEIAYDITGMHDAFLRGDPVWRPGAGWIGGALEFDGIDDHVETESTVLNPADDPFSVFVWARGGRAGQVLLSQIPAGDPGGDWIAADSHDGTLMTELVGPGGRPLASRTTITDQTWHHIGFTWDGMMRSLYVDGVVVAQDEQAGLNDSFGHLNIGCGKNLAHGTFWTGLIDDIRIYNQALGAEEVAAIAR